MEFGSVVRHKITGDEGVITAKFYLISGCVTVYSTSKTVKDRDFKAVKYYNTVDVLEMVGPNETFAKQPKEESAYRLGEKVKVPSYGDVEGVITAIAFYPDQAIHVEVQPPYNFKEGKLPALLSVAESQVVSMERGAVELTKAGKRPSPPCDPSPRQETSGRL